MSSGSVRSALHLVAVLVAIMWVSEIADTIAGGRLDRLGIEPRDADGLTGVVLSPFLHAGFGHLIANTIPFAAMAAAVALSGVVRLVQVLAIVTFISGAGVWLLARAGTLTVGASGVVFGLATYLLARGFSTRRPTDLALGALVVFVWGGALLGGLLPQPGVSWTGHAFGAVGGLVAARGLHARRPRTEDRPIV